MNAEVFINGKSLGIRPNGYAAFYYDITAYINPAGKNTIAVRVDNSLQKNSRWYTGSGIYRHVWLLVTEPVHIILWGVSVSTPAIQNNKATVKVKTIIKNETDASKQVTVTARIQNKTKRNAGLQHLQTEIPARGQQEVEHTITVDRPEYWSPETPVLYTAQITVKAGKEQLDEQTEFFGIRTITYSAEDGFLLNGKETIINGGCVHHDNGALGAAAFDRAEYRKAELLKAAGFNAVRTAHNPPSEIFLKACDEIGLLVMDEAFDGWRESKTPHDYAVYFDTWWQRDIEAMVLRDRNHPSVVFWSTGNEIIERKKPEAVVTAKKLADYVRYLDPTRPVTSAITTWDNDWEIFDSLFAPHDIGGYNYQLHRAVADHKRVPDRVIVQTESYPRDAFVNWKAVNDNKYIIGDFVWTAMDYLGESGIGRYFYEGETEGQHYERDIYPWHGAYCGDIDLVGWRKPVSHYRELLYNKNKKLYMAVKEPNHYWGKIKETIWSVWPTWESWNWPGHEGKNIDVEVYSRYPLVKLYLDDKLIGERVVTVKEEFKAVFTVPYKTGILRAVGVINGKEQESVRLQTAEKAAAITLKADRKVIKAGGQDLSFVTVEITDKNGIIDPNAAHTLTYTIEGAGAIIATDNANLQDTLPYTVLSRNAWKGRALVVIRSVAQSGDIRLEVNGEGLTPAKLNITAQ